MSAKKSMKKQDIGNSEKYQLLFLIPILIAIAVVPAIVFMKEETLTDVLAEWKGATSTPDFFNYYKAIWIVVCASIASVLFILRMYTRRIELKKNNIYIPMAIYCAFIILSTLLSQYKNVALFGFIDRHEGMLVLLSYLLLFFVTFNFVNNEKAIKWVIYALVASAVIVGGIGCFQYLGHDFFATNFGRHLILPKEHHDMAATLTFQFGKNRTYSTLFNPNYVASYVVMLIPILAGLMVVMKNIFVKAIAGLLIAVMFFNLLGSASRAGYAITASVILLLAFAFRKQIVNNYKKLIIGLCSIMILFFVVNALSGWRYTNSITNSIKDTITGLNLEEDKYYIKDISIEKNIIIIMSNAGNIALKGNDKGIQFFDDKGNPLTVVKDDKRYKLLSNNYKDLTFDIVEGGVIKFSLGNKLIYLFNIADGIRVVGLNGKPDVIHPIEKIGFNKKEKAFDGRGYIWSRTLPMLKKSILYGYGPDTYALEFPQNDYIGKLNTFDTVFRLVDKPHNLYLGVAVSSGVLSLIAFLVVLLIYIISSIKLYIRNKSYTFIEGIGVSVLISIIGYSILGIFNDSTVSVAPIFWILLGLGMACNLLTMRERKNMKEA